jgi:predicted O-methyltransferase YrrM
MHLPWRDLTLPLGPGAGPGISTSLLREEAGELARLAAGARVLEVGAAYGFSTIAMAQTARHIVSVDLPAGWVCSQSALVSGLSAYRVLDAVTVLGGSSFQVLPSLAESGEKFGLVFIDGDHAYDSVTQDARNAWALLDEDGVLACHDYLETCCCTDVKPALDTLFPEGPAYTLGSMAVYKK